MPRKPIPVTPKRPVVKAPGAIGLKPAPSVKPTPARPKPTSAGVQDRARNRLGRLVSRGGTVPAGVHAGRPVSLEQARAIKTALLALNAKRRTDKSQPHPHKPAPFDPLAPLSGKTFDDELAAASREKFGDSDQQIKDAYTKNQQGQELSDSYYDQYKKALADAAERVKANDATLTADSQAHVDQAFTEDTAAAKARSDAASQQAGKLGLSGTQGDEGVRAAAAARSQGNQTVAGERAQAGSQNALMENQGATALQAKAEALGRMQANKGHITDQATKLASDKGDFNVNYRSKVREAERNWAAVQSEFKLKSKATNADIKNKTSANSVERQKIAAQKIVARLYSDADKTKAAAQIRVAKLQLKKGKIDQKQYREIVNIYKGLPKHGTAPQAKDKTSSGSGSGAGGKLAPWEIDARDRAATGFEKNKYTATDRSRAIAKAVQAGIPARLARQAWERYVASLAKGTGNPASAEGTGLG